VLYPVAVGVYLRYQALWRALNLALENYPGTLIFVSHDREFVSSLATRIIELSPSGVTDFSGTYDDYLRSQGVVI